MMMRSLSLSGSMVMASAGGSYRLATSDALAAGSLPAESLDADSSATYGVCTVVSRYVNAALLPLEEMGLA